MPLFDTLLSNRQWGFPTPRYWSIKVSSRPSQQSTVVTPLDQGPVMHYTGFTGPTRAYQVFLHLEFPCCARRNG